jgi:thymidylate kinase
VSKLIVFSGTDGSGKSTQIRLLKILLDQQNFKVRVLWARGGYTPIFSFLKKFLRMLLNNKMPKPGNNISRSNLLKRGFISQIWLNIAILDLFIFFNLYIRLLNLFGFIVICDRYIEDTEIDFRRNFSAIFNANSLLWKLLVFSSPTPDQCFLLHVSVKVSLSRSMIKCEPFPDTPDTLKFRLKSYLDESIFPSDKYYKINCEKSIVNIQEEIKDKLKEVI